MSLKFDKKANIFNNIRGYMNSNFADSKLDWKLIKGYILILISIVISYLSNFYSIIILLGYKAKYVIIDKISTKVV